MAKDRFCPTINRVELAREPPDRLRRWRGGRRQQSRNSDGRITVVHVEHFVVQGALLDWWLGVKPNKR
ncbi:hypothetical protein M2323_002721 [Rhodoblastus acidophilus]|uniref:hypothetical protein n=1 Tax=Rhodoblastus acidophilus TaxID=1074 RepID=UPI002224F1B9|nr:hypothetical protein [Rhodoblastus acidophilus]MCW2284925.1 hypothetical protein [Rhodoblastus acidophilus]MCW2333785.1 hypothetical protein [Rhodoblastus acidophilus]